MTSLREEDGHETARKEKCTAPARMPWVSPQNCEGCGQCVNRCPRGILSMTETNVADVYVPWMKQVDKCLGCGVGEGRCPTGAMRLVRDEGKGIPLDVRALAHPLDSSPPINA